MYENYQRPLAKLNGIPALIDTGAIIPVFSFPTYIIEKGFGGKIKEETTNFGGFGGKCEGSIYTLTDYKIGEMTFSTMDIFVPKDIKPFCRYPIILSSTLFYNTKYEIDSVNFKFTVDVADDSLLTREFDILNVRGKLYAQIDGILFQEDGFEVNQVDNYTQFDIEIGEIIDNAIEESGLQKELTNNNDNIENKPNDNTEPDTNDIESNYDDTEYDEYDGIDIG